VRGAQPFDKRFVLAHVREKDRPSYFAASPANKRAGVSFPESEFGAPRVLSRRGERDPVDATITVRAPFASGTVDIIPV